MSPPLLAIKFHIPQPRPGLIARPGLIERFQTGLERPLTLISAPAGFGKTTLVSGWINTVLPLTGPDVGRLKWLSLDSGDNDPVRFWTYFTAALQTPGAAGGGQRWEKQGQAVRENTGSQGIEKPFGEILSLLQSSTPPALPVVLDALINELLAASERIVLVLDDFHLIQSPQVYEGLTYLLDHRPPNLSLVISTRTDPPLPISRLRARGQLSEIRAADLRFTQMEAAEFLRHMTGVEISMEDVAAVEARTEGWIAGLQMAALALQAQVGPSTEQTQEAVRQFIAAFSGKHIYVLDYLAEEVFNRQPEHIQTFLLQSSILHRMSASLCDAVVETVDWKAETKFSRSNPPSQSILEHLERSNLFLIPLDSERQWYRYHHLFADLLRARLHQASPEGVARLHQRASRWYEQEGWIEEAVNHALAAKDWACAARLVEQHAQVFLERGQLTTMTKWIEILPRELTRLRPRLCIQQAWALALANRMKVVSLLLQDAESAIQALKAGQEGEPSTQRNLEGGEELNWMRANIAILRGYEAITSGNPARALDLVQEGEDVLPPNNPWELSWLRWMYGYAYRFLGELNRAAEGFSDALRLSRGAGSGWNAMIFLTDLAMVCGLRGQLERAAELYQEALSLGENRLSGNHGYLCRVEAALSAVLLEQNKLDLAEKHATRGLDWSRLWPSSNHRTATFAYLSRIRLAKGDLAGAAEAIQEADQERLSSPVLPVNDGIVDYNLVRVWLAQGDQASAEKWASAFQKTFGDGFRAAEIRDESRFIKLIALARVRIEKGRQAGSQVDIDAALDLLTGLEQSAQQREWGSYWVETCALQAVAHYLRAQSGSQDGVPLEGLQALEKCLALAETGGYLRVFLDEGEAMKFLISNYRFRIEKLPQVMPSDQRLKILSYLESLLSEFRKVKQAPDLDRKFKIQNRQSKIVETLTDRELEVLQLLAEGLSNREMANRLFVAEGTIKTHVHNLIGKLDAQSRTHAIARAKELKIVE